VHPLVIIGAGSIATAATLLVWAAFGMRSATRELITTNLQRGDMTDLREIALSRPTADRALQPLVSGLAAWLRRLTPGGSLAGLERRLMLAGHPMNWPLERILATKVMLGGAGVVLVFLRAVAGATTSSLLLTVLFALLLFLAPGVIIAGRARERQREILLALPDSLDQMTICMEAGLGFEAAMARASQSNTGPLAQEMVRTLQEMQVGVGRGEAMRNLADRNDVADLRHFVTAVLQADNYGVPIANVLRDQARDLRSKRRQRAEEAARKLPLKLLFPLVLFILPPLFIILIGPAILRLTESFSVLR
jgi:tight adherence protein C